MGTVRPSSASEMHMIDGSQRFGTYLDFVCHLDVELQVEHYSYRSLVRFLTPAPLYNTPYTSPLPARTSLCLRIRIR
jgi:hypothetical protein